MGDIEARQNENNACVNDKGRCSMKGLNAKWWLMLFTKRKTHNWKALG